MEAVKVRPPEYKEIIPNAPMLYCSECETQLGRFAYFQTLAKQGKFVSPEWLQ